MKKADHFCALQDHRYALGNFINITPTLRYLFELSGRPVHVKFETEYVKQCFLDCYFIKIVEELDRPPVVSSAMVNKEIPDYQYIFKKVTGLDWVPVYHTYVDQDFDRIIPEPYAVLCNGTGNEDPGYVDKKDPGAEVYRNAISLLHTYGWKVYFTGSRNDSLRNQAINCPHIVGDIRMSLWLIRHADLVISNDTGLAHAAGAMDKPIMILWKDTLFDKNKNPGKNTHYSRLVHDERIDWFINIIKNE